MTTMIKTQPSSLTVIVHGGGNDHMSTSAAFTWTYQMCTHSFSEQGDWRVAYPLIVRRSLWLILDVAVHRLPGHRQAVEMGHLQRAHLLHLWSRPLLHALVWQQNGDREKVTVCVCEVSWCEEAGAQERRDRVASHVFLQQCRRPSFAKQLCHILPICFSGWLRQWVLAMKPPLWSHMRSARHTDEKVCCWRTNSCQHSTTAATERYEAGTGLSF